MRQAFLIAAVPAFSIALLGAALAESLSGAWRGDEGIQEVEWVLSEAPDGTLTGRIRGVESGVDLPITSGRRQGDEIVIENPGLEFKFIGRFDGSEIDGHVERPWGRTDLSLERSEALAPASRPQDPPLPLPYRSQEVQFASTDGDIMLAGTFLLPEGAGPFPAAILISPEGAQDRDGAAFGHRPHAVLADALVRRGIAVLRYDDRGIGASDGLYDSATTQGYAGDAEGAILWLKAHAEIDGARIALVGRNNGAVIAARAGMNAGVAALVLVSAPSLRGAEAANGTAARAMRANGSDEDTIAERVRVQSLIFEKIMASPAADPETLRMQIAQIVRDEAGLILSVFVSDEMIDFIARRLITPWFRDYLTLDPLNEFRRVTVPSLVIYGSEDRANPPGENMERVAGAISANGAVATTFVVPGTGANLARPNPDPEGNAYTVDETISPAAVSFIADFLVATLRAGG